MGFQDLMGFQAKQAESVSTALNLAASLLIKLNQVPESLAQTDNLSLRGHLSPSEKLATTTLSGPLEFSPCATAANEQALSRSSDKGDFNLDDNLCD